MASPVVRIRVREGVLRVRVDETRVRAVIRIPAPQDEACLRQPTVRVPGNELRSEHAVGFDYLFQERIMISMCFLYV